MKKSFVLAGAGQMPLECRVPLASREVQIQLMGSYSVAFTGLVLRERASVFPELCRRLRHREVIAVLEAVSKLQPGDYRHQCQM